MDKDCLISELNFKAVRSSGAGGQHVNKVSSKVVLYFDFNITNAFNVPEKERLLLFFKNRLNSENTLQLSSSESRSQIKNKQLVIDRFLKLVEEGLKVNKIRRKSKPSRSSVIKTKEKKKRNSQKKESRKRPKLD